MWCGDAHSGSGHFPGRNMVGKGSITSHCYHGLWFKFSREMRALCGLPLEKKRGA